MEASGGNAQKAPRVVSEQAVRYVFVHASLDLEEQYAIPTWREGDYIVVPVKGEACIRQNMRRAVELFEFDEERATNQLVRLVYDMLVTGLGQEDTRPRAARPAAAAVA